MAEREYDVAIVGYGPVGGFAALLLAEAGLRVAVVDRTTEIVDLPRAVGLDGETVRAFQRIGLGEAVAALLQAPRPGERVCFTDSQRRPLFGLPMPDGGPNGWREVSFFDQPELEALLRAEVARRPVDLFLGCEVQGVAQDDEGVTLAVAGAPGTEEIGARYVLGCDGASSFVREACGIDWRSLGYDQDWLVIDIVIGPDADLPTDTMQVCDPERLTTYVCVKDPNRRWEFQLQPGETREEMTRPETIARLLDPWLPASHYTLRRAAVYQFHAATAARWQEGRVLLAGDAAHQTPPFLGQGLNAGFRDAVNLAWKLPLVLAGTCEPRLLESYAAERDAHARDLVEWAVGIGQLMETLAAREAGEPDPYPDAKQSDGYGQGRTAPPLRDGVLRPEQVRADLPVGVLFRQPTVRTAGGEPQRLDELLGRGFAVIGRKRADLRVGASAEAVLHQIGARTLALEELEAVEGDFDPLFDAHAVAIVRPDRYVFGVADGDADLDALLLDLGDRLGLAAPGG